MKRMTSIFLVLISMTEMLTANDATVWFGTRGEAGIHRATLNLETGELSEPECAFKMVNCGFLALHPKEQRLYSLGRVSTGGAADTNLAAFNIGEDDSLSLINTVNSNGGNPTHLSVTHDGSTLLVAHYSGGGVASLPITANGAIQAPTTNIQHSGSSVDPQRQDKPHPHWIGASPDNKFAFVPDLGTDSVVIYKLNSAEHTLATHSSARVPDGAGPRHLTFHPTQPWAFVINELDLTVTAFSYDASAGKLTEIETVVALPPSEVKDVLTSGSEIRVSPNGRHLYAGIRGHDVIAVFEIGVGGKLKLIEREPIRGSWPRNFALDPTGRWLLAAGAESDTVSVFKVDADSGRLTFTRQIVHVPKCICVAFSR